MQINWLLLSIMTGYGLFNGIGSLCYKLGLQKLDSPGISLVSLSKESFKVLIRLITTPIWILGLLCLIIDFVIYQLALSLYDISVVKPLVNLNLLFVLLFGIFFLKEKILAREWFGILFIIVGAVLLTINSSENDTQLQFSYIWLFLTILGGVIILYWVLTRISTRKEFHYSIICGFFYGIGSIANKGLYSSNIGAIGKGLFLALFIISYIFAFLFGQDAYLTGRIGIVSTLVNIISILIPIIGGTVLFDESLIINSSNLIVSLSKYFGIGIIIIGIGLNYHRTSSKAED